jgi:hypothetical protein
MERPAFLFSLGRELCGEEWKRAVIEDDEQLAWSCLSAFGEPTTTTMG